MGKELLSKMFYFCSWNSNAITVLKENATTFVCAFLDDIPRKYKETFNYYLKRFYCYLKIYLEFASKRKI